MGIAEGVELGPAFEGMQYKAILSTMHACNEGQSPILHNGPVQPVSKQSHTLAVGSAQNPCTQLGLQSGTCRSGCVEGYLRTHFMAASKLLTTQLVIRVYCTHAV